MIMGHIGFGHFFEVYIHSFHMPMFFIISGLFVNPYKYTFKQYIKTNVKKLLVPYASVGAFSFIVWWIAYKDQRSFAPLIRLFTFNSKSLPISGALWYLTAFFTAQIIIYIIIRFINNIYIQSCTVVILSLLGCLETYLFPNRLPLSIGPGLVGVGLIYFGYIVSKKHFLENRLKKVNVPKWTVLFILSLLLIWINGMVNMRNAQYHHIPLFWINAIFCTILGIEFFYMLDAKKPRHIYKIIAYMGKNSIIFLCLNQMVILFSQQIVKMLGLENKYINHFFVLLITLIILYLISYFALNTKLKIIFGKK